MASFATAAIASSAYDIGLVPAQWVAIIIFVILGTGTIVWIPALAIFVLSRIMRHAK
jgi:hypothetical protein